MDLGSNVSAVHVWFQKEGEAFGGETRKETEKRGGIVKHFSEAFRFCLPWGLES